MPPSIVKQANKQGSSSTRRDETKQAFLDNLTDTLANKPGTRRRVSNDPTEVRGESRECKYTRRNQGWAEVFVLVGIYCWFRRFGREEENRGEMLE